MRRKPQRIPPAWESFSVERAARSPIAAAWIADNFVNVSVDGPVTQYELVKAICASAQRPIPVVSLCVDLRAVSFPRGMTLFNLAGDLIDRIANNHERVVWWVTDDGLHLEAVTPDTTVYMLSRFDQIAGSLVVANWEQEPQKGKTRLSSKPLQSIAIELDRAGLKPIDVLQRAQRKVLALHNQQAGKNAIGSFQKAIQNERFVRPVRKRLYVARDRYRKALETEFERAPVPIPKIYHSYPIYG